MQFRTLGNSGLQVSLAGLGTNNFGRRLDQEGTTAVINAALDEGINFFDTATSYGDGLSEEYIGKALGARRQDVVIASKFGWPGEAPDHVVQSWRVSSGSSRTRPTCTRSRSSSSMTRTTCLSNS